jgi:uncharacterized protein (DUF4415 family)
MRENREHTTRLSGAEARAKAPAAKREGGDAFAASVEAIREAQRAGATNLRAMADALNARGVSTATGKRWEPAKVANVLARIDGQDETDYARLDAMTDADIAQAVAEDPDAPPLDLDWTRARLSLPPGKDVVTLRLDRDVLEWLRAQGKGYQTLINQVLRAWYDAHAQIKRERTALAAREARKKTDDDILSLKEERLVHALAKKRPTKKAAAKRHAAKARA